MPYSFSSSSKARYDTLHPDLQRICDEVLKFRDCTLVEGHRPKAKQDEYFASGASQVKWPNSKHNSTPSYAMDLAPYIPGGDLFHGRQCLYFSGSVMLIAEMLYERGEISHKLRWGGDWDCDIDVSDNRFNDLVHFELIRP